MPTPLPLPTTCRTLRRTSPRLRCALVRSALVVAAIAAAASVGVPSRARAQTPPPVAQQIAAAVLPLPADLREDAGVMGYRTAGRLELLRPARNGMLCLADDPAQTRFHVACYHESLEPFMQRGRALRASGVTGAQVDTVRFAEVQAGTLPMPTRPAMLYSLTEPTGAFDPATGSGPAPSALFVTYVPFATAESTGLSTAPQRDAPWLMFPGTPKAHIMYTPSM